MMYRAVACVAVALLGVSLVAAQFPDSESEDLDLSLPAMPLPPKRDRELLHMTATVSLGERSEFEADDTPRFRALHAATEEGEGEGEAENEDSSEALSEEEEAAQIEAEADAEVEAESEAEGEAEGQAEAAAETTEEVLSEELVDDDAAASASAPRFMQVMPPAAAAMRFAQDMSRRYDTDALPAGPLPVQPSTTYYDIARLPVSAVGDALFTPIHNTEPQFPGAFSSPSLAGGVNNYAWPTLKRHENYAYGNTNWGAAVNTQFYPSAAPAPSPGAASAPIAASKKEKHAKAADEEAADEASLLEVSEHQRVRHRHRNGHHQRHAHRHGHGHGHRQVQRHSQRQHQTQVQAQALAQAQAQAAYQAQYQRATAAQGVVYPYAPQYAPRNTPARNPTADLMRSGYQTYSQANWPSSVPPPPAYYLPPDVVI